MFQFDPQRSGGQNTRIESGDYKLCWSASIPGVRTGSETTPLFVNGMVIVGAHSGLLIALNEMDGTIVWIFETRTKLYGTPVINEDKICLVSGDGVFYVLDLSGNLVFSKKLTTVPLRTAPLALKAENIIRKRLGLVTKKFSIGTVRNWGSLNLAQGKLYAVIAGRGLLCLTLGGQIVWERSLGGTRTYYLCGVAIDHRSNIYAVGSKRRLYCFTQEGDLKWMVRVARFGYIWSNPSIDISTKSIYLGTDINQSYGRVVCVGLDGKIRWRSKLMQAVRGSVIKGDNGKLYVCGLAGKVYIMNANTGEVLNTIHVSKDRRALWTSPTKDKAGNVLISVKINRTEGGIVKLNSEGYQWFYKGPKILSVPSINSLGSVVFGAWDSTIKKLSKCNE